MTDEDTPGELDEPEPQRCVDPLSEDEAAEAERRFLAARAAWFKARGAPGK